MKKKQRRNTPAARPKKFLSWKNRKHENKNRASTYVQLIWKNFILNGPERKKEQKTNWNTKKQKCEKKQTNYSMWTA